MKIVEAVVRESKALLILSQQPVVILGLVCAFIVCPIAAAAPVPRIVDDRFVPNEATFLRQRLEASRALVCDPAMDAYRMTTYEDVGSGGTYLHRELVRPFDSPGRGMVNRPRAPAPAHLGDGRIGGP